MSRREGPVVTIDGPAGSGKSTTAREVARRLAYRHLDSGALYRALTLALLQRSAQPARWSDLSLSELRALGVESVPTRSGFQTRVGGTAVSEELRTPEVTAHVSTLAALPRAREILLDLQRAAGEAGRLVADGRDMGTVVFPDAEVKVFLDAAVEERARRRLREEGGTLDPDSVRAMSNRIAERDRLDSERSISPLKPADDAHRLDTTGLDFDEQVARVVALVRRLTLP